MLALVLAETVAGAAAFVFLSPLWNEVRRGFFKLAGAMIVALSIGMWAGVAAARQHGSEAGRWSLWLSIAFTLGSVLWLVVLFARQHRAARVVGVATVPVAGGLLAALAGTSDLSWTVSFLQLMAGAVFSVRPRRRAQKRAISPG